MIKDNFNSMKAMITVVNKLDQWLSVYEDIKLEYDVLEEEKALKIETMRISINMNLLALYDTFVSHRFSVFGKTHIFKFNNVDEAVDLANNVLRLSNVINKFLVIRTLTSATILLLKSEPVEYCDCMLELK